MVAKLPGMMSCLYCYNKRGNTTNEEDVTIKDQVKQSKNKWPSCIGYDRQWDGDEIDSFWRITLLAIFTTRDGVMMPGRYY